MHVLTSKKYSSLERSTAFFSSPDISTAHKNQNAQNSLILYLSMTMINFVLV